MRWIVAAAFAFFLAPSAAGAWGPVGHDTVCEIAWLDMTETTRAAVTRLVLADGEFRSFTRTCNYPDPPPERRRGSEHFANHRRTTAAVAVTGPGCPTNPACVIRAIVEDLEILRSSTTSERRKREAIKFIGHWIGDIHQPLHISFQDDVGGVEIDVGGQCSGHLHRVWDSCIINRRIIGASPARFRDRSQAVAGLHSEITSQQRRDWRQLEPWQWAKESYEITLQTETRYCFWKEGACWYDEDRPSFNRPRKRNVRIQPDYLTAAAPLVERRLKQAGVRLAHELNETFDPSYRG